MQKHFGQETYRWSSMFFPLIIVILNTNKNKEKKMQIYFGQETYRWSSMFFSLIIVILNINKNKEKNTTD